MHYSSSPPASGKYTVRGVNASAASTPVPTKASAEAVNPQCTQSRSNLEILKGSANVQIDSNGDGKPDRLLSPEEHAAQMRLAEANIAVSCAPRPKP